MKLRDVIKNFKEDDDDFDVRSSLGCWIAYCGTQLTPLGEEYYKDVLDYECSWVDGELYVEEPDLETGFETSKVEEMLSDMAGYCSIEFYEQMFEL